MGWGGARPPGEATSPPLLLLLEDDRAQVRNGGKLKASVNPESSPEGRPWWIRQEPGTEGDTACCQVPVSVRGPLPRQLHGSAQNSPRATGSRSGLSHTAVRAQHWEWSLLEGLTFCFDSKFHAGSPGVHTARHSRLPNPLSATGDGRHIDQPLPGHLRPCHLALTLGRYLAPAGPWTPSSPRPPGDPCELRREPQHIPKDRLL